VHLVVDQVVELQHVHVADGHRAVEALAGAAVVQPGLAALGRSARRSMCLISPSVAPSNTGVAIGTPFAQVARQRGDLRVAERAEVLGLAAALVVHLVEERAQLGHAALLVEHAGRS